MKIKLVAALLFFALAWPSLWAVNLNKYYYQGIGKIPNKPMDYWVTVEFDDEDADFNVGDIFKFLGAYKCIQKGKDFSVTVDVPSYPKATLISTDNGQSLSGQVTTYDGEVKLWLLKVPKKQKKTQLSESELNGIISSEDGYTCFAILSPGSGGKLSVTSDFTFEPGNRFKMICDSPAIQEIFKNFEGSYSISDGEITLQTDSGTHLTGNIYDDGNYLMIPVGKKNGIDFTLVLIR